MAAAAMIFGCNCDSVDIDQNQVNGALTRIKNLKQDEALGGWSKEIEPAVVQLEALRYSRSWTGARAIEDWIARSSKARLNLGSRINEGKEVVCGMDSCGEKILIAKHAFLCGNERCDRWLHKNCRDFAVNKILACSKLCQDAILSKPASRPSAPAANDSNNEGRLEVGAGAVVAEARSCCC
jgi:hypothetical protein